MKVRCVRCRAIFPHRQYDDEPRGVTTAKCPACKTYNSFGGEEETQKMNENPSFNPMMSADETERAYQASIREEDRRFQSRQRNMDRIVLFLSMSVIPAITLIVGFMIGSMSK